MIGKIVKWRGKPASQDHPITIIDGPYSENEGVYLGEGERHWMYKIKGLFSLAPLYAKESDLEIVS